MRNFVKNVFLFALLMVVVMGAIEVTLLFVPNTYSYKRSYLESNIGKVKVLFLGSSYIEEGIKAEVVGENCFNMASSGRNIAFDAALSRKYVPRMTSLRVVVVPIDYSLFSFGRGEKNPKDKRYNIEAMTSSFWCMHYKYLNLHVGPFWYWSEILNSRFNYLARFWQSKEESIECDSLGYVRMELSTRADGWESRSLPPIINTSRPIDTEAYDNYYQKLLTIAECCKKSGVELLLVNTPKSKSYQQEINEAVMDEISEFVERISSKCSNTHFVEYSFYSDFEDADFYDACHLTNQGASKFSRKIGRYLTDNFHVW
jgi:hypothetical protein